MSDTNFKPGAPGASGATNVALAERARRVIVGGVNSPVRDFAAVGGTPRFFVRGRGAWLTCADGRDYVDLVAAWGPALLGHAHPEVVEAVQRAAANGSGSEHHTPTRPRSPSSSPNGCPTLNDCVSSRLAPRRR